MNIKLSIQHDRSQIPLVGKMVWHLCGLVDAGQRTRVNKMEVAVVELLTNIINYSADGDKGNQIEVHCKFSGGDFDIIVSQKGKALSAEIVKEYTNDAVSMPSIDTGIFDLPEGGFGIQLIKSACDEITYARTDEKNVFKMTFDLSAETV